jgi:MFS family permease
MQAGAFLGYVSFGFLSDRFGRRPVFLAFVLGAAAVVPAWGSWRSEAALLLLAPLVGYLRHGYFSLFGAMLRRALPLLGARDGAGLCYNAGRAVSALAPPRSAPGRPLPASGPRSPRPRPSTSWGGARLLLPETRGKELS